MQSFFTSFLPLFQRMRWHGVLANGFVVVSLLSIAGANLLMVLIGITALIGWAKKPSTGGLPWWVWGMCFAYPVLLCVLQLFHQHVPAALRVIRGQWDFLFVLAWLCIWPRVSMQRAFRVYAFGFAALMLVAGMQHYWGFLVRGADPGALGTQTTLWNTPRSWPATGPYSHHLTLAAVAMPAVLIFSSLLWGAPPQEKRWIWALGALGALGALLFSLGRSGWVGLVVGALVLALRLPLRKALAVLVLGGGLLAAGVVYVSLDVGSQVRQTLGQNFLLKTLNSNVINRVLETSIYRDEVRLFLWGAAWEGFVQRPWLGHGFAKAGFDAVRNAKFEREKPTNASIVRLKKQRLSPHNTYLRFMVSSGVLGLWLHLLMLGVLLVWFARALRKAPTTAKGRHPAWEIRLLWGVLAGLVSILAFSNFQELFFDAEPRLMAIFWFGAAMHGSLSLLRKAR